MKKTIFALTIASLLSAPALASKEGFYVGADLSTNKLEGESLGAGIGLTAGYNFQVAPSVVIGVEGEYRNFGEDSGDYFGFDYKDKAHSFGVNVKPKYFFNDKFYAGVELGLHNVTVDLSDDFFDVRLKESNTSLSYGLEAGYEVTNNVTIKGGYKAYAGEVVGVDLDLDTFYIGANYNF